MTEPKYGPTQILLPVANDPHIVSIDLQRKRTRRFGPLHEVLCILQRNDSSVIVTNETPLAVSLQSIKITFDPEIIFRIDVAKAPSRIAPWESIVEATIPSPAPFGLNHNLQSRIQGFRGVCTAWGAVTEASLLMDDYLASLLRYLAAVPPPKNTFRPLAGRFAAAWSDWITAIHIREQHQGVPSIPSPPTPSPSQDTTA